MSKLYKDWLSNNSALNRPKQYGISYYSIYSQDIIHILAYLGKPPSAIKVLDFGMGWGQWALMAKAFGCEVYGTELSEQRVEFAKDNGIKIVQWKDIPK